MTVHALSWAIDRPATTMFSLGLGVAYIVYRTTDLARPSARRVDFSYCGQRQSRSTVALPFEESSSGIGNDPELLAGA